MYRVAWSNTPRKPIFIFCSWFVTIKTILMFERHTVPTTAPPPKKKKKNSSDFFISECGNTIQKHASLFSSGYARLVWASLLFLLVLLFSSYFSFRIWRNLLQDGACRDFDVSISSQLHWVVTANRLAIHSLPFRLLPATTGLISLSSHHLLLWQTQCPISNPSLNC